MRVQTGPASQPPSEARLSLSVGLRINTAWTESVPDAAELSAWQSWVAAATQSVFDQCEIHLDWQEAQLIAVPSPQLELLAIPPGSKVGAEPIDKDAREHNYSLNARLEPTTRAFLAASRENTSDSTILIHVVDRIRVHRNGKASRLGGFAFIPSAFHAEADFPARNAVAISGSYPTCGSLPRRPTARVIAHELGHMLLDSAHHEGDTANLMSRVSGPNLTASQCEAMQTNLGRLYGSAPMADPRAAP